METRNTYQKTKLERYSLMASALLLTATSADAAIVYTDVSPDELVVNNLYDIDLDGDGAIDFTLFQSGSSYPGFSVINLAVIAGNASSNLAVATFIPGTYGTYSYAFPAALSVGAPINDMQTFASSGPLGFFGSFGGFYMFSSGAFIGATDKYIGVQFDISGSLHYGWIRVDVASDVSNIVVKDFAYESVAGVGIAAGDGISSAACDATLAPNSFAASVSGSSVTFTWDEISNSVGCQLSAGPAGAGFPITRNFTGSEINSSGPIPLSIIPPGNYEAKVRCACEITPVPVVTPFSNSDNFTVPSPRLAATNVEASLEIGPNPSTNFLKLRYNAASDETVALRITNIAGQELYSQSADFSKGSHNVTFDVSEFESGLYLLQIVNGTATISERFEVIN